MSEWFAPVCQQPTSEAEFMLGAVSALLALLVLVAIVLGFGPMRAWLGMGDAHRSPHHLSTDIEGGILAIWRLYRQFGRMDPTSAALSVADTRPATPDHTGEQAHRAESASQCSYWPALDAHDR